MRTIEDENLIILPNRHRRFFDEKSLRSLADSIKTKGLLNPPTLRDDNRTLLQGERRVRAIRFLHKNKISFTCDGELILPPLIPYTRARDLDPDDLEEAELEENLIREDLTWQEKADAKARLFELRKKQKASRGETQTLAEFTRELLGPEGGTTNTQATNDDLLLAKNLHDPDIAQEKDRKQALKILKRKKTAAHNAVLAQEFKARESKHKIVLGNSLHIMKSIESKIDVIIADPPYGIGANDFGTQADAGHSYDDSEQSFWSLMKSFAPLTYSSTKPQAHLYLFCDIRNFFALIPLFEKAGWYVWHRPIIWFKGASHGMIPQIDYAPRNSYETILYAIKGKKMVNAVYSDVIDVTSLAKPKFGAEKPVELYTDLLTRSARPNDIILDPFAGSGPILPACENFNCRALAIELDEEKVNYMHVRLEEGD